MAGKNSRASSSSRTWSVRAVWLVGGFLSLVCLWPETIVRSLRRVRGKMSFGIEFDIHGQHCCDDSIGGSKEEEDPWQVRENARAAPRGS